jgi:4-amino-4-deoxy-L-arabinose transferase-like glycosyltransferase
MNYGWFVKLDNRGGHYALLMAAAAGLFFLNLGGPTLWDIDEGKNATAAYEMMVSGDWIKPTFNAALRADKPALLYWLQILAYRTFGVNEFAARFPSALAALLTLLVAYELGRSLFGPITGLLSGLVTASTPMVIAAARFANPDALLNLFVGCTLLLFWTGLERRSWFWFVGLGVTTALAALAKGPIGLLLPMGVSCLFLFWSGQMSVLRDRRWALSVVTFILVAMPWYILVTIDTKAGFVRGFLGTHHVGRFLSAMEDHGEGPFFYLIVLAVGFAPWSVFLPVASCAGIFSAVRRPWPRWQDTWNRLADRPSPLPLSPGAGARGGDLSPLPLSPGAGERGRGEGGVAAYRFLWCWAIVFLVFYSLSATKLPNYILPSVLPLAVLVARFWDRWRLVQLAPPSWVMRVGFVWLGVCGLLVSIGLILVGGGLDVPSLRTRHVPGLLRWVFLGGFPVAGCGAGIWLMRRGRRATLVAGLMASVVIFYIPMAAWVVMSFNQVKAPRTLVAQTDVAQPRRDIRLACFKLDYLPSLNFYSRRDVDQYKKERDVADFFATPLAAYLFVPEDQWRDLQPKLTGSYRVIGRHPDFYRGRDVLVVTND